MNSLAPISSGHQSRHIVITGATSGIGRAIALRYAAPGIHLSLIGRDAERMDQVLTLCRGQRAIVRGALIDVTDASTLAAFLEDRPNGLDVDTVVAAAGMGGELALAGLAGESREQATRLIATNTLGVINTLTPLLPGMVARRAGRIAVIGSTAGWLGLPQGPAYSGSKAAVEIYAEGLRRLLAGTGVQVTMVLPGFVDTPMSRSLGGLQPWRWSAERAASRIVRAIERGERRCIFPWQMRAAFFAVSLLPVPLLDRLLAASRRLGGGSP